MSLMPATLLFDHLGAQAHFGASVLWLRRLEMLGSEEMVIQTGKSSAMELAVALWS
jgi:hypothetical protein